MAFNKGDKIRFKDDGTFGYITEVAFPKCTIKIPGKAPVYYPDTAFVLDAPVAIGTWCVCPRRNNVTFVIVDRRQANRPKKDESDYEYQVKQDTGPGLSAWINGAELNDFRQIGRPSTDAEFFTALQNQTKLIHLPRSMKEKGFALAYRGDDRKPGVIFESGFSPRNEKVSPIFRTLKEEEGKPYPQFDIETSSGVCASHDPKAAGLFPLIKQSAASLEDTTFVYAFFAYQSFYTCKVQEEAKRRLPQFAENIEALLKGSEIVLGSEGVPAATILLAFEVKRSWKSTDWTQGCRYMVSGFTRNHDTFYEADPEFDRYRLMLEQNMWTAFSGGRSPVFA